jgi:hypothetical protein
MRACSTLVAALAARIDSSHGRRLVDAPQLVSRVINAKKPASSHSEAKRHKPRRESRRSWV